MSTDYRSTECEVSTTFRCTNAERERLMSEARAAGLSSLQQYMELKVLGSVKPRRKAGPSRPRQPQELPLELSA